MLKTIQGFWNEFLPLEKRMMIEILSERMNGEVRDREKVMRGLKKTDTDILKGYQIYHNFLREHQALDGKTPSEACGITINGENKWKTLIQNASNSKTAKDVKS